jgi:two-component system phosphate regulon response regulator PhoB
VREPVKVVAVLAATPALSSIMTMVLAGVPDLRVREFESRQALLTYMRLSPVHLLVCDFDSEEAPAGDLARALRTDDSLAYRDVQIIALASSVTPRTKQESISSGIEEVVIKPMSPKYLLERVLSRLRREAEPVEARGYRGPERRGRASSPALDLLAHRGDNVVSLFKDGHPPVH